MALRLYTKITIEQQGNGKYTASQRDNIFVLDFVNQLEVVSTWQNLTDTCKIILPRNLYILKQTDGDMVNMGISVNDKDSEKINVNIYNQIAGNPPLFMRGDKVTVEAGYYFDQYQAYKSEVLESNIIFRGYISKISNRVPIVLECEDEMFKIKQIPVINQTWKASEYTLQSMLTEMLKDTGIVVKDGINLKTSVGDFKTQNETVGNVLDRLKAEGSIYSYLRIVNGVTELRASGIVYYPQDTNSEVFEFQNTIIKDDLEYQIKDDLNVALKLHSTRTRKDGTNKDGTDKMKEERVEIMYDRNGLIPQSEWENYRGSVVNIPVLGAITEADLLARAKEYLPKFYYTGFKGSFTTFGLPIVRHGDIAILQDKVIPERSGSYLIKSVTTSTGVNGFRQKVILHMLINDIKDIANGI